MCDIVFEKAKAHAGKVNRTSGYVEAAVRSVVQKRCYEKLRGIHKKSFCTGVSLMIKLNSIDLELH